MDVNILGEHFPRDDSAVTENMDPFTPTYVSCRISSVAILTQAILAQAHSQSQGQCVPSAKECIALPARSATDT